MPFTLSHPAAVLPLRRFCPRYLEFAALAIGSITPDVGYYIARNDIATFSHTVFGTCLVCLPIGGAMWIIFRCLRERFCFLLPMPHRAALTQLCANSPRFEFRRIGLIAISILLGAWSHIIWDSFTHQSGWFVQNIPPLRDSSLAIGPVAMPVYYILQQISTLVGAVILIFAYKVWLRKSESIDSKATDERWRYLLWIAIFTAAAMRAVMMAHHFSRAFDGFLMVRVFIFKSAVYWMSIAVPLTILASMLTKPRQAD